MSAVHLPSETLTLKYLKEHPCTKLTDEKVLAAAAKHFANK